MSYPPQRSGLLIKKDRNQTETSLFQKRSMLGKQVVNQALGQMDPRAQTVLPSTWYVFYSLSPSDSQTTTTHSLSKGDPYSLLHTAPSGRWGTERGTGGSRLNTISCQKTTTPADGHTLPYVISRTKYLVAIGGKRSHCSQLLAPF